MSRRKTVTTMNDIIKIINTVADNEQKAIQFIDALASVMPVKKIKKADPYLNKTLAVKRYNGIYTVQVVGFDSCLPDCYIVKVISIDSKTSRLAVGDSLIISKRELQLTSKKVF